MQFVKEEIEFNHLSSASHLPNTWRAVTQRVHKPCREKKIGHYVVQTFPWPHSWKMNKSTLPFVLRAFDAMDAIAFTFMNPQVMFNTGSIQLTPVSYVIMEGGIQKPVVRDITSSDLFLQTARQPPRGSKSVPLILYSDGVNAASHGTIMFNTAPVDVGLLSNSNAAQNTHI